MKTPHEIILSLSLSLLLFLASCAPEPSPETELYASAEGISIEEAQDLIGEAIRAGNWRVTSCADSDGGKSYGTFGSLTVTYRHQRLSRTGVLADECKSRTRLKEYFCDGGQPESTMYACTTSCASGACVNPRINATNVTNQTMQSNVTNFTNVSMQTNSSNLSYNRTNNPINVSNATFTNGTNTAAPNGTNITNTTLPFNMTNTTNPTSSTNSTGNSTI